MFSDDGQADSKENGAGENPKSHSGSGSGSDRFDLGGFQPRPDAKPAPRDSKPRRSSYGDSRGGQGYQGGRGGSSEYRGARRRDDGGEYRPYSGGESRSGGYRGRSSQGGYSGEGQRSSYGSRDGQRSSYGARDGQRSSYGARDGQRSPYAGKPGYRGGPDRDKAPYDRDGSREKPPFARGGRDSKGGDGGYQGGRGPRRFSEGGRTNSGYRGPQDRGDHGYAGKPSRYPQEREGGVRRVSDAYADETAANDKAFTPKASPEIRIWLQLKTDKGRYRHSRFLLEGAKAIQDLLALDPGILVEAFIGPQFKDEALLAALKRARITVHTVLDTDIALLSDTETPQGIIAVANFAALKPDWTTAHAVTLLDGVQDPGNLGAIFRTSLALGMDALILGRGCCDPYNGKVLRSSVGALMRMPFETDMDLASQLSFLRQKGFTIVATSSHAKSTLDQVKLKRKVALVVGNEGAGSGANILDLVDAVVKIPLKKSVESLNVSVAHGILCHELMKPRGAQLS